MNTMTIKDARPTQITLQDKTRLKKTIDRLKRDHTYREDFAPFDSELNRAQTVRSRHLSRNVVTMNSRVALIDLDTAERLVLTLVFPEDAEAESNKVSVVSQFGSAMLGCRIGDKFKWKLPEGTRRFVIEKVVYQPEAERRSLLSTPYFVTG